LSDFGGCSNCRKASLRHCSSARSAVRAGQALLRGEPRDLSGYWAEPGAWPLRFNDLPWGIYPYDFFMSPTAR
jgi:hypothetical protein